MIATIATLKVQDQKVKEFEACFAQLTRAVRANEPDTLFYQLCRSKPGTYKVIEVYRSEAAAQLHRETSHFRTIAPVMVATLASAPDIEHYEVVDPVEGS